MKKTSKGFRQKTVLIDMPLRRVSDRDALAGIFQYIDSVGDWNVKLRIHDENPLTAEAVRSAQADGMSGFIVSVPEPPDLLAALAESPLPTVTMGFGADKFPYPPKRMAEMKNDSAAIGIMGAKYLMSLGRFMTFAFIGEDLDWHIGRREAFGDVIKAHGHDFHHFERTVITDSTIPELSTWLSTLSRPIAIMAGCDRVAIRVIDACESASISIPEQAAILGIDNDEFLCSHSVPPLSSILPSHREMGFRAAKELDRMVTGKSRCAAKIVTLFPVKVVERESTTTIAPATMLIERAKMFIAQNACSGISVNDVVKHLRVSQRLAELRYRAITGETMKETLLKTRLSRVKRLLASTLRPIAAVAEDCGFRNPNNLAPLFKKRFGVSMSEWRTKNRPR